VESSNLKNKMNDPFNLTTPVLFLVFNRLDTAKKVFSEIKKAKPKQLFIASDGPRKNKEGEKEAVEKVRKHILNQIDWKCNVKTLFRKKNLGCKNAVSSAIDWFFENVEQGIILEDDCLPDSSFFRFCQELLIKYKDNNEVTQISAQNYLPGLVLNNSYTFSKYPMLWGWATWGRAWRGIYNKEKFKIETQSSNSYLKEVFPKYIERKFFEKRFLDSLSNKVDTWEFPWVFGQIRNRRLTILPNKNLVVNEGISLFSTNTKENKMDEYFLKIKRNKIIFPLKHPKKVKLNYLIAPMWLLRDALRVILKKFFKIIF